MALSDYEPDITKKGPACRLGTLYDSMTDTDKATLLRWLDTKDDAGEYVYTGRKVADSLVAAGYTINADKVIRHRKRSQATGCKCAR